MFLEIRPLLASDEWCAVEVVIEPEERRSSLCHVDLHGYMESQLFRRTSHSREQVGLYFHFSLMGHSFLSFVLSFLCPTA